MTSVICVRRWPAATGGLVSWMFSPVLAGLISRRAEVEAHRATAHVSAHTAHPAAALAFVSTAAFLAGLDEDPRGALAGDRDARRDGGEVEGLAESSAVSTVRPATSWLAARAARAT